MRQYLNLAEVYGAVDRSRANQMDMENARMQQEQFRNQVARQQREEERVQGLRDLYKGAIEIDETGAPRLNEKALPKKLYEMGYGEEAIKLQGDLQKREIEAQKAQREAQKEELSYQAETLKQAQNIAATIYDDASLEQARPMLMKIAPNMPLPERFDAKWRDNITLTAEGRIKQIENELNRGVTMRGQDITMRGQDLSRDTALRGQDLSASTARRGQDITASNAAQRLAFDRSGGTAAVNAKNGVTAKPEKLTEGMRNNAMYAQRMTAAEKLLEGNNAQKPTLPELGLGFSETAANAARSPERRQALQAQRDWVRAKLRKESGAAIGEGEMQKEIETYFPQLNDDAGTIEQKRLAREQATQGLIQSSGGAYTPPAMPEKPIMNRQQSTMPKAPKLGTVDGGYVYTGGNPSDPKSWKKK
jgi:hypothetical protein